MLSQMLINAENCFLYIAWVILVNMILILAWGGHEFKQSGEAGDSQEAMY